MKVGLTKMKTGTYVIEYGREPFLAPQMQREASGALHHRVTDYSWVVCVARYSTERTLNELKGTRKYSDTRKGMAKWIKYYKKIYKGAKVESLGFG